MASGTALNEYAPEPAADVAAATALLDTLRAALRGTDPAGQVPARVGGYLISDPDEPAEKNGRRPIGELRRLLADAAANATMTDEQRWVVSSFYGLDGFPADLEAGSQSTSLVGRVPLSKLRRRGSRRAGRSSVEGYRRSGVAALAAQLPLRPTERPVARQTIPPPHAAQWFYRPPPGSFRLILAAQPDTATARQKLLRVAVDDARGHLACAGQREPRLQHALGSYAAAGCALGGLSRPSRTDTAAAVSAVSVALWDLMNDAARCRAILEAAAAKPIEAPPMPGTYLARGWLVAAPADAAPLAAGQVTVANLDAAARATLDSYRSGSDIRAMCELCLWALRKLGSEVPPALTARVLMLAGRAFRHDRSWRTVTFANEILRRAGPCELWFNAAQDAVMAAGEVREFTLAETILDDQQHLYRTQFRPGPHLIPSVDIVEFSQQIALIRAGVKRRQAETAIYNHRDAYTAAHAVKLGWPLAIESRNRLDDLPDGWDGFGPGEQRHGGDATLAWMLNPLIRQGELLILRAILARRGAMSGSPLALLDQAERLSEIATRLAQHMPTSARTAGMTQVAKLDLAAALAADEADLATAATATLKALGVAPNGWGAAADAARAGRLDGSAADVIADLASSSAGAPSPL